MAGLGGFGGFAGGFAQTFFPAMHQQQEMQLERQRIQNQQQRELMAKADSDRKDLWDRVSDTIKAVKAKGGDDKQAMNLVSTVLPALRRLTKSSGRDDSMIDPQIAMILASQVNDADYKRLLGEDRSEPTTAQAPGAPGPAPGPAQDAGTPQQAATSAAFAQAPQSYTPGQPMPQGPSPASGAGPVPFMQGDVGGAAQPAAYPQPQEPQEPQQAPAPQPPQAPSVPGTGGQQQGKADLPQQMLKFAKVMTMASRLKDPGMVEYAKGMMKRLTSGASEKDVSVIHEGGRVFLLDKTNKKMMEIPVPPEQVTGPADDKTQMLDPNDKGDQFLAKTVPPQYWSTIKAIDAGLEKPPNITSRGGKAGSEANKLRMWVNDYNMALGKTYDENLYRNHQIAATADTAADAATVKKMVPSREILASFMSGAGQLGNNLIGLAQKVDYTGVPVVDRWLRAGAKAVAGDPEVTAFDGQMLTWRSEVARTIMGNPNLAGQLTDQGRREVQAVIDEGANPEQVWRAVKQVQLEFSQRITAWDEGIERARKRLGLSPRDLGGPELKEPAPLSRKTLTPDDLKTMSTEELEKLYHADH